MNRTHIDLSKLQSACERIQSGEQYKDVAASLGVGRTALRGCLKRAGLQYEFGGRHRARVFQKPAVRPVRNPMRLMAPTSNDQRLRWV